MRKAVRSFNSRGSGSSVQRIFDGLSIALTLALAFIAVAMSSGPAARMWTSNYIVQAFAPTPADLDGVVVTEACHPFRE